VAAFAAVLAWPLPALKPEAHRLASITAAVVVLWITEALPMPVTALAGASACVLLGVDSAREVFRPFADPLMFLFIGSFILARALFLHRLDRRLAFAILSAPWVGSRPGRILFAYGAVTAFISAWISNTATTAMMYPIAMSILGFLLDPARGEGPAVGARYATGMMLMATFASSVGGLATPIGAAPNLIGLGLIRDVAGIEFSFLQWCAIGVPAAVILFLYVSSYLGLLCRARVREIPGSEAMLRHERDRLGPWTTAQRSTVAACGVTLALWIVPGLVAMALGEASAWNRALDRAIPEPVAALIGAILLFLLPGDGGSRAITWDEASRIDWGVILLFGGGVALGVLSFRTGLAEAVGRGVTGLVPVGHGFGLLCAATLAAAMVSELTSNTASANMVVPVVIAIAQAAHLDPLEPALGATLGSGLGFMLPVSTPTNAIVYGSGLVPMRRMASYGLMLDVVGVIVVVALVQVVVPLVR
jgi:sodium-dependent dicarboxylate transporter 2/3/5